MHEVEEEALKTQLELEKERGQEILYGSGECTSLLEIISFPAVSAELHQQISSLSLQLSEAGQAAMEREAELVHALEVATSRLTAASEV